MRQITLDLGSILEMVACADDYGWAHQNVLMFWFWESIGSQLTDAEIEEYCQSAYLSENARAQGYGEEDYDSAKETITEWRNQY